MYIAEKQYKDDVESLTSKYNKLLSFRHEKSSF